MSRCLLLAIGILASHTPALEAQPSAEQVKRRAEEIAQAVTKGDLEQVIDSTYPPIVKVMGGKEQAVALIRKELEKLKEQGIVKTSSKPGDPSAFHKEGKYTFVVIPTTTQLKIPRGKIVLESYLLGLSENEGKQWYFVDGAGMDMQEHRAVLPKFPASLKLPAKKEPQFIQDGGAL